MGLPQELLQLSISLYELDTNICTILIEFTDPNAPIIIDQVALAKQGDNEIGSVHVSVGRSICLCMLSGLNCL